MYLMDMIVETAHKARKMRVLDTATLSIFRELEDKLQGAPRFLFDEDSIKTAVELTLGRPKVLREAMQHLTIPYPRMWIEWPESGREKLRQTFSIDAWEHPGRPLPKRLGFFLETDNGRKGTAYWAWNNHIMTNDDCPNICPISPFFDLDSDFKASSASRTNSFLDANLVHIWKDNPIQLEALLSIWDTSVHAPSIWGRKFLNNSPLGEPPGARMSNFYADVYGEYIMIWSVMMLLTSSKKIVELVPVDNTKWNKARKKQGKIPKLDHTYVTMHVGKDQIVHQQGVPLGFTRKSPRIHLVGSYLARRGNKHWVVQPYWRGKGEMISRYVKVKT